jgi:hypothetical protein
MTATNKVDSSVFMCIIIRMDLSKNAKNVIQRMLLVINGYPPWAPDVLEKMADEFVTGLSDLMWDASTKKAAPAAVPVETIKDPTTPTTLLDQLRHLLRATESESTFDAAHRVMARLVTLEVENKSLKAGVCGCQWDDAFYPPELSPCQAHEKWHDRKTSDLRRYAEFLEQIIGSFGEKANELYCWAKDKTAEQVATRQVATNYLKSAGTAPDNPPL